MKIHPIRFSGRRVAITAPITGKAMASRREKVWIEGDWPPSVNRSATLPTAAATANPHVGHAIHDAVLLVMPDSAPRRIVAPVDTAGKGATPIPGTGSTKSQGGASLPPEREA